MTDRHRPSFRLAVLAAVLLATFVAPAVDARMPRATRYHAGGPITLDTNLRSISGVSAWAIDEYLAAKTPLPALGTAFIKAEKRYRVNARFLLAAALHESGWGTSSISRGKHNLFGLNAYDRDPGRFASAFATYAANIDATARFMRDAYLTPGGRWWGGAPTLRSMQQYWSSSGRWGKGVSRIATSIRLGSLARRSIRFEVPSVSGPLHGGRQATVRISWRGGAVPSAIGFVARWVPVELDADVAAVAGPDPAAGIPGVPGGIAPAARRPTSVTARRVRTGADAITLAVAAPRAPGRYSLDIEMLDAGRRPLPAAERLDIPAVEVRIWADRAVSYDLRPSPDGTGAVIRITNTGRTSIPSAPDPAAPGTSDPEAQPARSLVTVTASASDHAGPKPVVLLVAPLAADLAPGASVDLRVPRLHATTGRTTTWLSVTLSILGDTSWLTATASGAWFPGAGLRSDQPAKADGQAEPTPSADAETATPAPTAQPAPTAKPTPTPASTAKPTAKPTATPAPTAKPAATHSRRTYSERSSTVRYRGAWNSARGDYTGGSVAWSKTPGATATFTFTGSSVSWVGPKGPTRGLALVLLDGRAIARVDMWRSSFMPRTVLFKRTFRTAGRHTLTIRVLSSPGHPYVAIDGFLIRR